MSAAEPSTKFDFMKYRYFWYIVSIIQIVLCIVYWNSVGTHKYSIDFLGGTDLVVKFNEPVDVAQVRSSVANLGVNDAIVQGFDGKSEDKDKEFSIRYKGTNNEISSEISKNIQESFKSLGGGYTILKNDYVGPVIGEKIKYDGFKAVIISIIGLLIYIAWRFEWYYGVGAIVAVFHDVFISAAIFVFFGGEIGAGALAALLTILGYSVNDTIVTYDRIRENLALKAKSKDAKIGSLALKDMDLYQIINLSVNQTLSRTILTGGTTLFTCLALYVVGGGTIAELSFVLAVGIIVGTYSSIFVAAPMILMLKTNK